VTALLLSFALLLGQSDEARAKTLFKDGETAYNLGQFEAALTKYSQAYKLKALPGFLFNIAQCHRQLQQYERAAFFYGRYLDTAGPKAPQLEVARGLLEEMKQKQAATPPVEEKKPLPADDLKRPTDDRSPDEAKAREELKAEEHQALSAEKARDELKAVQLTPAEPPPAAVPLTPAQGVVQEEPVYKKGWFWGVVIGAVVVVAGGVTAVAIVASPKPRTPTLGPNLQ
jgi:tetratricopeptide (TPR) repeat protein